MANTIIRASAGSGKTFQLSNQYLDIVFQKSDDPVETIGKILASTFTRKAAGEILERILRNLAEAATDDERRKELTKHVKLPDNFREILGDLARNLYRFRVSTLDAFFSKIASTFALELGLPPGWAILDDIVYARCLEEAVRNVVNNSDTNEVLTLMSMLQQGEQDRNVTRDLIELATNCLSIFRESEDEHWEHEQLWKEYHELKPDELQKVIERFNRAELPKTQKGTPVANFVNARRKLVDLAMKGEWKNFLASDTGSKLVQNVIAEDFNFSGKEVEGEILYCTQKLIGQAKSDQIKKLIIQTRATRDMLKRIAKVFEEILLREHGFRFDDITDRLGRDVAFLDRNLLAHRIDAHTEYLLLDEFQDTSLSQWKVVEPFAREAATSPNGSVFVVGDVKQAIYGWKGGVAEIFDTIQNFVKAEPKPLNDSWRSSLSVIKMVNLIFENIKSNSALRKGGAYQFAAEAWNGRFKTHKTMKKDEGYCVLKVAQDVLDVDEIERDSDSEANGEDDSNKPKEKWFTQYKVNQIAGLYEAKPTASIGVLVRSNDKIGKLIAGLKKRGIEASEEGGNPLTDSPAVQQILSAMTLADHPGDRIARFHLAKGPLAEILKLTDYDNDHQARRCSFELRSDLVNKGYGAVVERLANALAPSCNPRDFQRLEKLMELARRFQETATGVRADRFVQMVEATKKESPTASPIQIMTIHKSKGLEFDIVVLPDLDVPLTGTQTPKIVVARKTPTAPIDFVIRYAGKDLQPLLPPNYRDAFEKRVQGVVEESLSLLYVALTRAKQELVMIVPPLKESSRSEQKATFAGILQAGLPQTEKQTEDSDILFQIGDENWYEKWDKKSKTAPKSGNKLPKCLSIKPTGQLHRNLPRISASELELEISKIKGTETSISSVSTPPKRNRDDALLWGTAMHTCFEHGLRKKPWLDEGKPDAKSLRQIVESAILGKKGKIDSLEVVAEFLKSCDKPNIRKTLSRSSYAGKMVEVEHERCFAVRLDDGFLHGSIDRLVILRESGKVTGLEIIDYKTDRFDADRDKAEFLAERQKVYTPQLKEYQKGMSRLYGLDSSNIKMMLLFIDIDEVLQIP